MSLRLDWGSKPDGVVANTYGMPGEDDSLHLGKAKIKFGDFFKFAVNVFTGYDLEGIDDPRIDFVMYLRSVGRVPGFFCSGSNEVFRLHGSRSINIPDDRFAVAKFKLGGAELSLTDFLYLFQYVLTNTNLGSMDIRELILPVFSGMELVVNPETGKIRLGGKTNINFP